MSIITFSIRSDTSNSVMLPPSWHSLRSEEHTSELQSLMRISYAVFCFKEKGNNENYKYGQTRSQHDDLPNLSLPSARCEITCALQPAVRAITNSGVNIGVGTPIMW